MPRLTHLNETNFDDFFCSYFGAPSLSYVMRAASRWMTWIKFVIDCWSEVNERNNVYFTQNDYHFSLSLFNFIPSHFFPRTNVRSICMSLCEHGFCFLLGWEWLRRYYDRTLTPILKAPVPYLNRFSLLSSSFSAWMKCEQGHSNEIVIVSAWRRPTKCVGNHRQINYSITTTDSNQIDEANNFIWSNSVYAIGWSMQLNRLIWLSLNRVLGMCLGVTDSFGY